eukprot:353088-Chlamydomonas_euryale.AAC.15
MRFTTQRSIVSGALTLSFPSHVRANPSDFMAASSSLMVARVCTMPQLSRRRRWVIADGCCCTHTSQCRALSSTNVCRQARPCRGRPPPSPHQSPGFSAGRALKGQDRADNAKLHSVEAIDRESLTTRTSTRRQPQGFSAGNGGGDLAQGSSARTRGVGVSGPPADGAQRAAHLRTGAARRAQEFRVAQHVRRSMRRVLRHRGPNPTAAARSSSMQRTVRHGPCLVVCIYGVLAALRAAAAATHIVPRDRRRRVVG